MTTLFRGAFNALRKIFWWKNPKQRPLHTVKIDPSTTHLKVVSGKIVSTSAGPYGNFAVVRINGLGNNRAIFSYTKIKPDEGPPLAWNRSHPPHVGQWVNLYDLYPGKKRKHWIAHKAERA